MPKVLKKTVRERKKQLRKLSEIYTLRKMAKEIFKGRVSFQVLGRFIKEKDYIPTQPEVLEALELIAPPNPYRMLPKWYKRTPESLAFFNSKRQQIKQMYDEARKESRKR